VLAAVGGGLPGFLPGLVVSGINQGENLGTDILYSGTAAAARQAALLGLPGIALSLAGEPPFHWDMAVDWSVAHLEELISLWKNDTFINVNIPNNPQGPEGAAVTWPALKDYHDRLAFEAAGDGDTRCTFIAGRSSAQEEEGSDCDAISRNLVSISPIFLHPVVRRDLCAGAPDHAATGRRPPLKRAAGGEPRVSRPAAGAGER
jgi:5'-nucleotidase